MPRTSIAVDSIGKWARTRKDALEIEELHLIRRLRGEQSAPVGALSIRLRGRLETVQRELQGLR